MFMAPVHSRRERLLKMIAHLLDNKEIVLEEESSEKDLGWGVILQV